MSAARLKVFQDNAMDQHIHMDYVLRSKADMSVGWVKALKDGPNVVQVIARWKGPENSEDFRDFLKNVYKEVPTMVKHLLVLKIMPTDPFVNANAALFL